MQLVARILVDIGNAYTGQDLVSSAKAPIGSEPMITLRRTKERRHIRRRKHDAWMAFDPQNRAELLADGFGALENFNEERFSPGAGARLQLQSDSEIITYVFEGALAQEDSTGYSGVIYAGEFQRMTVGHGVHYSETNPSRTDPRGFSISVCMLEVGVRLQHRAETLPGGATSGRAVRRRVTGWAAGIAFGPPRCSDLLGHTRPRATPGP